MAFASRVSYTGSTSTGPYSFSSISLFDDSIVPLQSQLVVTITGAAQVYTASAPVAGEYSMDKTLKTITLGSAPASADIVKVTRSTASSAYVDFTNNSPLTAADLDIATQQSLFLAEEGIEAIEAGDAVLALPELTDADSTMAPSNGDFLRWDDGNSQWVAQAYVADGTGPDVNIVTDFPASPVAGDMIYHSVFGAAYIYDGAAWQYLNGSGAVTSPAPGTTVTELTFETEGALGGLTLPSGWHAMTLDGGTNLAVGSTDPGNLGGVVGPVCNDTTASGDWVDVADPAKTYNFENLFYATGMTNTSGTIGFSDATFDGEAASDSSDIYNNTWWGGASESNAALDATAVLLPRMTNVASSDAISGKTTAGTTNAYRSVNFVYPAGISWATQSWRVTTKMVAVQPGGNGSNNDRWAGISFIPEMPFLSKGATYWDMKSTNDEGGLGAAIGSANYDDLGAQLPTPVAVSYGAASTTSGGDDNIVPLPGIGVGPANTLEPERFASSTSLDAFLPSVGNYSPYLQHESASQIPSASFGQEDLNGGAGSLAGKAIAYTVTTEWDSDAKVMTTAVLPDSASTFNVGNGSDTACTVSTPVESGDYLANRLASMSTDFWFGMGFCGGYIPSSSNWGDGLVSIKIETL